MYYVDKENKFYDGTCAKWLDNEGLHVLTIFDAIKRQPAQVTVPDSVDYSTMVEKFTQQLVVAKLLDRFDKLTPVQKEKTSELTKERLGREEIIPRDTNVLLEIMTQILDEAETIQ